MIPEIDPVNNYSGNSSITRFDFDFLINSADELKVLHTNNSGVQAVLVKNIDYSVNEIGNKNGSYITFPLSNSSYSKLSSGEIISLLLDLPYQQESEFGTSATLSLPVLEQTLDYVTRLIQILKRQVDRSVKIQEGSTKTPDEMFDSLNQSQINAANSAATALASENNAVISANNAANFATSAASSAASVNLPNALGKGTNYLRQKPTADGLEYRTPVNVADDIGLTGHINDNTKHAGSSTLVPQCVNTGRLTSGKADAIGAGTALRARIFAAATPLRGNSQSFDQLKKFLFNTDFNIPKDAPANRRSSIVLLNGSTGDPVTDATKWDYSCQRRLRGALPIRQSQTILPNMTSDSQGEWVISASSYSAGFSPFKAVDGTKFTNQNGWGTASGQTGWWKASNANRSVTLSGIAINAYNNGGDVNYNPKDFTIKDQNGNILKTIVGETGWTTTTRNVYLFDIPQTVSAIEINVTTNKGNGATILALGEVELLENVVGQELTYTPTNLLMDFTTNFSDKYNNVVTVIGLPTLSNGKFVGNGTNSGLKCTTITNLGQAKWSIEGKFKFNNTNGRHTLFRSKNVYGFDVYRNTDNRLAIDLSSNGSTWDLTTATSGTKNNFDTTTEYFIRVRFTGTAYEVAWSTDGINYTTDITVTSSATIPSALGGILFGIYADESQYALNGTMDDLRITIGNYRVNGEPFVADQYWEDTNEKVVKYGSPSSWAVVEAVFLGEITTNATTVIDAITHPYDRSFNSNKLSYTPSPTPLELTNPYGYIINPENIRVKAICIEADQTFIVGDELSEFQVSNPYVKQFFTVNQSGKILMLQGGNFVVLAKTGEAVTLISTKWNIQWIIDER